MQRERVMTDDLVEGMILIDDVVSNDGQLLVTKNTEVTSRIITRLKFYSISFVYIEKKVAKEPKEISYYKTIIASNEFKRFNYSIQTGVKDLEQSINNAITYNEDLNVDRLLKNVEDIVDDAGSGLHLMTMIQCIRGYDDLIYVHCLNVALICNVMADWLKMSEKDKQVVTIAGLLHDIGKTVVPKELLLKTTKLTDEEFEIVKQHAARGYELIRDRDLDNRIKLAVLQHHERCDGKGYPFGFQTDRIDKFSKIVAIADVYDAMTANRVYRQAICPFDVIETFEKEGYQKYDTKILLTFLERISQCYLHANVLLSDGREGEVIMINNSHLSSPVVKVNDEYVDLYKHKELRIKSLL